MKFTGGQHQFVVATHTDKRHIHTHIEFNSTNLNCDAKFQNVKNSAFILRRMNDELCRAYGLSVIENPKKKAKSQKETAAAQYGVSHGAEIAQHEAAKKAFDALDDKPIPKVAQLSAEYAALLEEKREQYEQYKALRQDMITYQTALRNVDQILGLEPPEQTQEKEQPKPER